ncbi:unnamed protein product, partial [Echinostoma caproni]|uniref:C2H2-type domain-containing protein n=1 Tax=Echinostoma caproni TaxID=27848 RepID=A0A183A4N6_9TREM
RAAAAAAAAAAASASSTQNTDHESPDPSIDASDHTGMTAQEFFTNENYANGRTQRGGGKRRRRRGAANSRPYRRMPARNTAGSRIDAVSNSYQNTPNSSRLDELDEVDSENETEKRLGPSGSIDTTHSATIACPYPDCQKTFDDLVSMRYHFSMGHTTKHETSVKPEPRRSDSTELHANPSGTNNATDTEFICVDDSGPISSPPPLGQAHEQVNASQEDCTEPMAAEDGFDNLEPPRLHRIVSITDSTNGLSQGMLLSSPSKQGDGNDEPPAPSPAYSDISDDGTVPADQSASFLDSYNLHLMTKLPSNVGPTLLSPSSTVYPANSPRPFSNYNAFLWITLSAKPPSKQ